MSGFLQQHCQVVRDIMINKFRKISWYTVLIWNDSAPFDDFPLNHAHNTISNVFHLILSRSQ